MRMSAIPTRFHAWLACIVLVSTGAAAADDEVAELYFNSVKPGMGYVYELGRKNHMAFHAGHRDPMTWLTWEVVTGDSVGSYIIGTFGHRWEDFDGRESFDAADAPDAEANMGPSEAGSQQSFYLFRRDLSRPEAVAPLPSKYALLTVYRLVPAGVADFVNGVMKLKAARIKTGRPGQSAWYELVNGGEGPTFLLSEPKDTWAAFQSPDESLDDLMRETYGGRGAVILSAMRKAIRSTYSETIEYRPDLSYVAKAP